MKHPIQFPGAQPWEPIPDFPGFVASLLVKGYARNPCRDHCQDKAAEHEHLRTPDGEDLIVWADGRWSGYDLTQSARLIYPAGKTPAVERHRPVHLIDWLVPGHPTWCGRGGVTFKAPTTTSPAEATCKTCIRAYTAHEEQP